jgi:putative molybdopterin biosynthesis protein
VAAGDADAGLGLRATAAKLDLGFVPVGTETVTILANEARTEKAGVRSLEDVLTESEDLFQSLPGYSTVEQ